MNDTPIRGGDPNPISGLVDAEPQRRGSDARAPTRFAYKLSRCWTRSSFSGSVSPSLKNES